MFWPFIDARGWLEYCPLADFGGVGLCEGADISGCAVVAEPVTVHEALRNASELAGRIALVQRGQCDFVTKALRVQRAGAIAVLVANSPSDSCESDNDSAFVMDAGRPGRHSPQELAEVRIPAMMMPYSLAAAVFKQARTATLEHREFSLAIKLLGAQRAAWVLEQRELMASSKSNQLDAEQRRVQREQRQQEAAKVLRSRLGGLGGSPSSVNAARCGRVGAKAVLWPGTRYYSTTATARSMAAMNDVVSDVVSANSEAFTELLTTRMRRWELESDQFDLDRNNYDDEAGTSHSRSSDSGDDHHKRSHSSTSSISSAFKGAFHDSNSVSLGIEEEHPFGFMDRDNQSLLASGVSTTGSMLHPLCPMTTALVILDVQNQFALHDADARQHSHRCDRLRRHQISTSSSSKSNRFRYVVENELLPTVHDVLLASRACEGIEIVYSVVESATRDGRERSPAFKRAGIHVTRDGFGAQIPTLIAPNFDRDFVLPRPGINVFEATNLDYLLRNLSISHVVVMGLNVLGSIDACVQSALDRGYHVTLVVDALLDGPVSGSMRENNVEDAAQGADQSPRRPFLDRLGNHGAQVVSAADFVRELHSFAC